MESIMKHKQHKDNLAATQTQSHPNCQIGKDVEKMRSFMQEDGNKHKKAMSKIRNNRPEPFKCHIKFAHGAPMNV